MAELERAEHNDEGRAREWMARALNAAPDPQWTADGHVSDRWLPVSPVSGRLDAFEWRVPLTGMVAAPVIEPEPPAATPSGEPPRPRSTRNQRRRAKTQPAAGAADRATSRLAAVGLPAAAARGKAQDRPQPKADPVIPLVHAPDDPGPEAIEEAEQPPSRKAVAGARFSSENPRIARIGCRSACQMAVEYAL